MSSFPTGKPGGAISLGPSLDGEFGPAGLLRGLPVEEKSVTEPSLRLAELLDSLVSTQLKKFLRQNPNTSLRQAYRELSQDQQVLLSEKLGPTLLGKFFSLSEETHPAFFHRGLFTLAAQLQENGDVDAALELYHYLESQTPSPELSQEIQRKRNLIFGTETVGQQVESFLGHGVEQLLDVPMLAGMVAGGFSYRMFRALMAPRLFYNNLAMPYLEYWGRRGFLSTSALLGESAVFTGVIKGTQDLLGQEVDLSANAWLHEFYGAVTLLGSLRFFGFGFSQIGRKFPLSKVGNFLASSTGMYLGILNSQVLQRGFNLHSSTNQGIDFFDAFLTLLHFQGAGLMVKLVTPKWIKQAEQDLDRITQHTLHPPRHSELVPVMGEVPNGFSLPPPPRLPQEVRGKSSSAPPARKAMGDFEILPEGSLTLEDVLIRSMSEPPPVPPTRPRRPSRRNTQDYWILTPNSGVATDLFSLMGPRPTLGQRAEVSPLPAERVRELEEIFERGGFIETIRGSKHIVERSSGAQTLELGQRASPAEIQFFDFWRREWGFSPSDPMEAQRAWQEMRSRIKYFGKELSIRSNALNRPSLRPGEMEKLYGEFGGQIRTLYELLDLLPDAVFDHPNLKGIYLNYQRMKSQTISAYDGGGIYIYEGTFRGSRNLFSISLLHELGASHAHRYFYPPQESGEINLKTGGRRETGDSSIELDLRKDMNQAYRTLVENQALLGLDYLKGPENRVKVQEKNFINFMGDLVVAYVAAGPRLRSHILSFPEGSLRRDAWDLIYGEVRKRIFSGREYDYPNLDYLPTPRRERRGTHPDEIRPDPPESAAPKEGKRPSTPPPKLQDRFAQALVALHEAGHIKLDPQQLDTAQLHLRFLGSPGRRTQPYPIFFHAIKTYQYPVRTVGDRGPQVSGSLVYPKYFYSDGKVPGGPSAIPLTVEKVWENGTLVLKSPEGRHYILRGIGAEPLPHPFSEGDLLALIRKVEGGSGGGPRKPRQRKYTYGAGLTAARIAELERLFAEGHSITEIEGRGPILIFEPRGGFAYTEKGVASAEEFLFYKMWKKRQAPPPAQSPGSLPALPPLDSGLPALPDISSNPLGKRAGPGREVKVKGPPTEAQLIARRRRLARSLLDLHGRDPGAVSGIHLASAGNYLKILEGTGEGKLPEQPDFLQAEARYFYDVEPVAAQGQGKSARMVYREGLRNKDKLPREYLPYQFHVVAVNRRGQMTVRSKDGGILKVRGTGKRSMVHPFRKGDFVIVIPKSLQRAKS